MHFLDASVLSHLVNLKTDSAWKNRETFSHVLESFVFGELCRLASFSDTQYRMHHYRDRDQLEVDFVVEDEEGRIAGIEVKAGATVTPADFKGLRQLVKACGDGLALGLVLYDGDETLPFGEKMYAAPLSSLWRQ